MTVAGSHDLTEAMTATYSLQEAAIDLLLDPKNIGQGMVNDITLRQVNREPSVARQVVNPTNARDAHWLVFISENAEHLAAGCIGNADVLALRMGAIHEDHKRRQRVGSRKNVTFFTLSLPDRRRSAALTRHRCSYINHGKSLYEALRASPRHIASPLRKSSQVLSPRLCEAFAICRPVSVLLLHRPEITEARKTAGNFS